MCHSWGMDKTKCLYPGCGNDAGGGRGLCGVHYQRAHNLVKSKAVTWEQLESAGKTKPPVRFRITENTSWFLEGVK